MHIGIFTDCYYPQINGVVTSIMMLEEELQNRGHEVTIITIKVPNYIDERKNVIRIKSIPIIKMNEFRLGIPFNANIIRMIKKLNLDVVHTHTEFSVGLLGKHIAKTLDLPLVHTYHTMYEDYTHYIYRLKYGQRVVKKMVTKSCKIYAKKISCIIAPTDKTRLSLRSYGIKNDIQIVPTGIDIHKFEELNQEDSRIIALRAQHQLGEKDYVMLSLGRISKEKNIDFLIREIPELTRKRPEIKLLIVGDGPYLNYLKNLVEDLGVKDHVIFTGRVPYDLTNVYYSLADLFVNASFTETQGLTIIEAMASNLPVVVYDDTNVENIVMEGISGRLFKSKEVLVSQILAAIDYKEKTEQMQIKGREIVNQLSKERYAENAEKIYNQLILEALEA
jgi:1,2-diacylglycerol 3-alpha-glucosyltransferase